MFEWRVYVCMFVTPLHHNYRTDLVVQLQVVSI